MIAALAEARPFIADALVLLGVLISTIGVWGAVRMRDTYIRLHAASVIVSFGVISISLAAMFAGVTAITLRVILIVSTLGFTAPIAVFAMARAEFLRDGQKPVPGNPDRTP
jgi:multicomponent Na+:H+ antiporter subunit G